MMNLLINGGFEADWSEGQSHLCLVLPTEGEPYYRDKDNVSTPLGWVTWYCHEPGVWDEPEVRDAWARDDPRRARSGSKGMLLFTFCRKHKAGFLQQVYVKPGVKLRLTAYAHAWSNHEDKNLFVCWKCGEHVRISGGEDWAPCPKCGTGINRECKLVFKHGDDGRWSEGPGYDIGYLLEGDNPPADSPGTLSDWRNFTFRAGIDPTGGTDPRADTVVWGQGCHAYNEYSKPVPPVEAVAEGGKITVFLRSETLWPFKHNDAYWDDAELIVVGEEPPPEEPEPEPLEGGNKWGGHVLRAAEGVARLGQVARVMKLVGDWGAAAGLPKSTLVIGRVFNDGPDAKARYDAGVSPELAAYEFLGSQITRYHDNPVIRYWEGDNEQQFSDAKGMAWYARFEIERMRIMEEMGRRCVIGNFSTGTPDLPLWEYFVPACRAGRQYEAILGLHEYSCPWMWWMTGTHQVDPGEDQGDEGWTTLRYRKVYRQYLEPHNAVIPLVITECGLDRVGPLPPDYPEDLAGPWTFQGDFWRDHDNEPDAADYYFRNLWWYERNLELDYYVIGATIFTLGSFGEPWSAYDIAGTPVLDKIIADAEAYPAPVFDYDRYLSPTSDGPEPLPTPGRGQPRVQYERTYVLLPPDADGTLAAEVMRSTWDRERWTVGGSADDAGIGDLDSRSVIAVSPQRWTGTLTLEDFFKDYYPGVEYAGVEYDNTYQLRGRLLALGLIESGFKLAYPTTHMPPHITSEFGVWRNTLYHNGLDLRSSWAVWGDEVLCAAAGEVVLAGDAGVFGTTVRVQTPSADGRIVQVCYCHLVEGSQTVSVGDSVTIGQVLGHPGHSGTNADHLHLDVLVLDQNQQDYADPALLIDWPEPEPSTWPWAPTDGFTLRAVSDLAGGEWLYEEGLQGWCVYPAYLGTSAQQFEWLPRLADAGIRVIVRLSYSYATDDIGGVGGIAPPSELAASEDACARTMERNPRAWGFYYGNELNNRREWPEGYAVTSDWYVDSYNRLWEVKPSGARLAPMPIDPYNAGWGRTTSALATLLNSIYGADFLAFHAYCHGPELHRITHDLKFSDPPLTGLFYDLRTLEDQQSVVPQRFRSLPQIVTETNHLFLDGTVPDEDKQIGWHPERGPKWVGPAYGYFWARGVACAAAFRFNHEKWRFGDLPEVLQALRVIGGS